MTRRLALAAALGLLAATASAADLVRLWPRYRPAADFDSISEHFTGTEDNGRDIALRTQPASRDGFYFLARLRWSDGERTLTGYTIRLEIIPPGSSATTTHTFTLPPPARTSQAYHLGITGADWPHGSAEPSAWRLTLLAPDGTPLLSRQSFLWSLPG